MASSVRYLLALPRWTLFRGVCQESPVIRLISRRFSNSARKPAILNAAFKDHHETKKVKVENADDSQILETLSAEEEEFNKVLELENDNRTKYINRRNFEHNIKSKEWQISKETNIDKVIELTISAVRSSMPKMVVNRIVMNGLQKISTLRLDKDLTSNKDVLEILTFLGSIYTSLPDRYFLNCTGALLSIFSEDDEVIKKLNQEAWVKLNSKRESSQILHTALEIFQLYEKHQTTPMRKQIVAHCRRIFEKYSININHNDISFLFQLLSHNWTSEYLDFIIKLEQQCLSLIDTMTFSQLCDALYKLTKGKARNKTIIQAIIHNMKMKMSSSTMSLMQIANTLYSCCQLSINNADLFNKICSDILASQVIPGGRSRSILTSFAILRWCDKSVVSVLMSYILADPSSIDFGKFIPSLGTLNYCPDEKATVLQEESSKLMDERFSMPLEWLDIVWSLTILKLATPKLVGSVLDEKFVDSVIGRSDYHSWKNKIAIDKLRSIDCASKYDMENYNGAHLPHELVANVSKDVNRHDMEMRSEVIECLHNLIPQENKERYCRKDSIAEYGYVIDAELCVDSSRQFVELSQADSASAKNHKVAVVVIGFHETLLPGNVPIGPVAMKIRHLKYLGYKVLIVRNHEWGKRRQTQDKLEYIQNALNHLTKPGIK